MDWSKWFNVSVDEENKVASEVKFADIGCGYGGLLITLSEMFPDKLSVGFEIRVKVCDYVQDRIKALRVQQPGSYNNVACIRSNAMKYLPNFFKKGQVALTMIFILDRMKLDIDYILFG